MAKLNQVLAIEKGKKSQAEDTVTSIYQSLQKPAMLAGITRTYQPKSDDPSEGLPGESTLVQLSVNEALDLAQQAWTPAWDITATKEWSNLSASADVVLDDETVLVTGAPVSFLLYLEKQLVNVHTLVSNLPVLDPAQRWSWDSNSNTYKSDQVQTTRTQKTPRVIVKYDATPEHPAQTELLYEDNIVGTWTTTHFSGAVPAERKATLLERVRSVQNAVKVAREAANNSEATQKVVAKDVFANIFAS